MFARKVNQTVWEIKCLCGQIHTFDTQGVDLNRVNFEPYPCDCDRIIDWEAFQSFTHKWTKFLQGHWTKEMPLRTGVYSLADYKGRHCGDKGVIYIDPKTKSFKAVESWGGYWWSVPTPDLPPVPEE